MHIYIYHASQAKEDFSKLPNPFPLPCRKEIRFFCMATQNCDREVRHVPDVGVSIDEDRTAAGWLQRFRVCAVVLEAEGIERDGLEMVGNIGIHR